MAKMFATDHEQKPLLMRGRFLSPRQRGGVTGVTDDTVVTDDTSDTDDTGGNLMNSSLSTNSLFSSKYINMSIWSPHNLSPVSQSNSLSHKYITYLQQ